VRVLLDENIPVGLSSHLAPHQVDTVNGLGWSGIKNGELLRRATDRYDVLITMDPNLKDQQPLAKQTFGVILVRAASNRLTDLIPLVPEILAAIDGIKPGELRRAGA
jgi:predicted nuclease of predicted toxin-antitoxin system